MIVSCLIALAATTSPKQIWEAGWGSAQGSLELTDTVINCCT